MNYYFGWRTADTVSNTADMSATNWTFGFYMDIEEEEMVFLNNAEQLLPDPKDRRWVCEDMQDIAIHQANQMIEHMELDRLENMELYEPPVGMPGSMFTPEFRQLCFDAMGDEITNYLYESDYIKLLPMNEINAPLLMMEVACNHIANLIQKFAKSLVYFCWQNNVDLNDPNYFVFPGTFQRMPATSTVYADQVMVAWNPDQHSMPNARKPGTVIPRSIQTTL